MSGILKKGLTVDAESCGLPCRVISQLGTGGQGEVYKASLGGAELALKWYFPEWATSDQRLALEHLIKKEPPSPMFLWPLDLVSSPGLPEFGYLMPLRDPRFRDGREILRRRIEPTFRTMATTGFNLAQAFLLLHSQGLAYRDISFGNFFVEPDTGGVMVCDLDNVGVDGNPHNQVGGTAEFMAPEIIRGEAHPSAQTDLHSLAVLLFYMFIMNHPMDGKREAAFPVLGPAERIELYGRNPVYIAHPTDDSNRPVPGRHDNAITFWPIYPPFLKKLFERSFTVGLSDPFARVRESEWRAAMVQLRDVLVYCGSCQMENFLPLADGGVMSARKISCWKCQRTVIPPFWLKIGTAVIALNHDTKLYPHHINAQANYDFSEPLASVRKHPQDPFKWGLRNLTSGPWTVTDPSGQQLVVDPGRSISLQVGTKVQFASSMGELCYNQ